MDLLEAVRDRLLSLTALTTLVEQRVYQNVIPQREVRPSVKLDRISEDAPQHLRGPMAPQTTRVQTCAYVTVKGSTDPFGDVAAVGAAIHGDGLGREASGLFGFSGDIGDSPAEIRILNVRRAYTRGPFYEHENEVVRAGLQQDYLVEWKRLF